MVFVGFIFFQFQFQSGAVKSKQHNSFCFTCLLFQFQSGAVKSTIVKKYDAPMAYFNSKVVRLKGLFSFSSVLFFTVFQFQSGAVKRVCHSSDVQPLVVFQFQSGAVKSKTV